MIDDKPEDQIEDDFDLDDEIDDFDDDSWDDDLDLDIEEDDDNNAPASQASSMPGQKTFVQKFFLPIVLVIVALFGGLFLIGTGALKSKQQPPQTIETAGEAGEFDIQEQAMLDAPDEQLSNLSDQDELPPMPSPVVEDETNIPASTEDEALTPLPEENMAAADAELPNLEEALDEPYEIREAAPVTDIKSEEIAAPEFEIDAGISGNVNEEIDNSLAIDPPTTSDVTAPAAPIEITAEQTQEIETLKLKKDELTGQNELLENQISEAEERLNALKAQLETVSNDVSEKQSKLSSLDKQINDKQKTLAETAVVIEKTAPKAKPAQPSKPAPVSTAKPRIEKDKNIKWVLRSARPGRASIAPKDSNDLRTVEIGETVSGLGQITYIGPESGRWVVRGTKGIVTQ